MQSLSHYTWSGKNGLYGFNKNLSHYTWTGTGKNTSIHHQEHFQDLKNGFQTHSSSPENVPGVLPCPCSGAVWKVLIKKVQPILPGPGPFFYSFLKIFSVFNIKSLSLSSWILFLHGWRYKIDCRPFLLIKDFCLMWDSNPRPQERKAPRCRHFLVVLFTFVVKSAQFIWNLIPSHRVTVTRCYYVHETRRKRCRFIHTVWGKYHRTCQMHYFFLKFISKKLNFLLCGNKNYLKLDLYEPEWDFCSSINDRCLVWRNIKMRRSWWTNTVPSTSTITKTSSILFIQRYQKRMYSKRKGSLVWMNTLFQNQS